jgi:hypothetical protein
MNAKTLLILAVFLPACTYIEDNRTVSGSAAPTGEEELLAGISTLSHALWDRTAGGYVSAQGVDYTGFNASAEDGYVLKSYVDMLAQMDPTGLSGRDEKIAYYVNYYNTGVVYHVLEELKKDDGFRVDDNGFAFFDGLVVHLAGVSLSLNVLEHGVMRGDWNHESVATAALTAEDQDVLEVLHADLWGQDEFDPRLHFVLNCASVSCPPLHSGALTAANLEDVIEESVTTFLADPARGAGPDGISRLFDWFAADFERAGYAQPKDFISVYRDLGGVDTGKFLDYDWSLNHWVP